MSSYIGRHAQLYDMFYSEKNYEKEAAVIHQILTSRGDPASRLLELACGTGSLSLALEKHGYKIDAFDYSEDMIAQARQKASACTSHVHFYCDDMTTFSHTTGEYDAALCLFDSIGYVITNKNIHRVMTNVKRTLSPGGLFIFEFWNAAAMLKRFDPVRVKKWQLADREVVRISETSLNPADQTADVAYSVYELLNDGTYFSFRETQRNRYFLLQEMKSFLENSGFFDIRWYSDFDLERSTIDEDTWHILAVARKGQHT